MKRGKKPRLLRERFEESFSIDKSGCWVWEKALDAAGYGRLKIIGGGIEYAHRISYRFYIGEIPIGTEIDHLCRNRSCCNPEHLEAVTHRENVLRSPISVAAMNRMKIHCKVGHVFDIENTRIAKNGCRNCKICFRKKDIESKKRCKRYGSVYWKKCYRLKKLRMGIKVLPE